MSSEPLILNGKWYNYPYIYDIFSKAEDYNQKCVNFIKKYINDNNVKIINPIDIGSGTGKMYHQLLKDLEVQGNIFLIDNNTYMINYLNKSIKSDIKNINLIKSNFIISSFAFPSCILNKDNTLKELKSLYELLLDDGILITVGWNEKWDDEFSELWKKYLNIDYSNKIKSIRNCHLSWYKEDIRSIVKFSNNKERDSILGNLFGNEFIKDYSDDNKLEWTINMGITLNTKREIKSIIDNWE